MFDHVSIGVRDIANAKSFYDATLKPLRFTCLSADETSLGYGKEAPAFWILKSESPVPDDPKSGSIPASRRRTGRAYRPSMPRRSRMAAGTTASPVRARTMVRAITRLSS